MALRYLMTKRHLSVNQTDLCALMDLNEQIKANAQVLPVILATVQTLAYTKQACSTFIRLTFPFNPNDKQIK